LAKSRSSGTIYTVILIIDNYDSYSYNLVQYVGKLGFDPIVFRNDKITVERVMGLPMSRMIISPGPKDPDHAGSSLDLINYFMGKVPILGVCLGHQAIGQLMGAKVVHAKNPMHGKTSSIQHNGSTLFEKIPSPFQATRYHSLILEKESIPDSLDVTAWTDAGEVMAIQHKKFQLYGVQFHPESYATEEGLRIIQNFLNI